MESLLIRTADFYLRSSQPTQTRSLTKGLIHTSKDHLHQSPHTTVRGKHAAPASRGIYHLQVGVLSVFASVPPGAGFRSFASANLPIPTNQKRSGPGGQNLPMRRSMGLAKVNKCRALDPLFNQPIFGALDQWSHRHWDSKTSSCPGVYY